MVEQDTKQQQQYNHHHHQRHRQFPSNHKGKTTTSTTASKSKDHHGIRFLRNHMDHLIQSTPDDRTVILNIDTTTSIQQHQEQQPSYRIQCQFTCLTEQLWKLQFSIHDTSESNVFEEHAQYQYPSHPHPHPHHHESRSNKDFSALTCINQQLLDDAVNDAASNRNCLTLKRTEVNSSQRGVVREVIFTPQSVRSEREQMLHGNLSSSRGYAPCVELVIYHFEHCNEKWCSFYFRNERGYPFQRNWEFGVKEELLEEEAEQKGQQMRSNSLAFKFDLSDEVIGAYGLGIGGTSFNKLGQKLLLENDQETGFNCPFVLLASNQPHSERDDFDLEHSSKCFHGVLVDAIQDQKQTWNLNASKDGHLTVEISSSPSNSDLEHHDSVSCYIFAAISPEKVLQIYTNELTGKSPLPPLWALGTHFQVKSDDENMQQLLSDFKEIRIPVDCLHVDSSNQDLTNHKAVHIVSKLIDSKSVQSDTSSKEKTYLSGFHCSGMTSQNALESVKTVFENQLSLHKGKERPFVICENGISGIQQYAWNVVTSDKLSWSNLREYLKNVLNFSLSGQSGCGISVSDSSSDLASSELLIRFVQLTCLLPYFQLPSDIASIMNKKINTSEQKMNSQIISAYVHLRYQLMPFLYTQMQQSFSRGVPFCKPMFIQYPMCEKCYDPLWDTTQFLIGDCLLVAPIMNDQSTTSRQVYLPPDDTWYELNMDETCLREDPVSNGGTFQSFDWHMLVDNCTVHSGDQIITIKRPQSSSTSSSLSSSSEWISRLPIFVRAGSLIPIRSIQSPLKSSQDLLNCDLKYVMFPDKRRSRREGGEAVQDMAPSEGVLYVDDGHSMDYSSSETGQSGFGLFRLSCSEPFCGIDNTLIQIERISGSDQWKPELTSLF